MVGWQFSQVALLLFTLRWEVSGSTTVGDEPVFLTIHAWDSDFKFCSSGHEDRYSLFEFASQTGDIVNKELSSC